MSQEKLKKITVEVSESCWKKLKIVSIQKDLSLPEHVKDILERNVSKKSLDTQAEENIQS